MALTPKSWQNLPAELIPQAGETVGAWHARIAAYDAANPGTLTPIDAAALTDLEQRLSAHTDTTLATEAAARAAADTALDTRVDVLEARPLPEVTQAELDAEAAARTSGDAALDTRVDVLEARPLPEVTQAELDAEAAARAAHEADTAGVHGIADTTRVPLLSADPADEGKAIDARTGLPLPVGSAVRTGLLAARGAAADYPGGQFFATDDVGGTLYVSDGTTWHTAGPRAVELGLTTIASDFATTSTSFVLVTGMYVDVTVRDRPVMLRSWFRQANHSAVGTWAAYVALREQGSATNLAFAQIGGSSNVEPQGGFTVEAPISPSAGAHRYEVWCAVVTAGTLTLKMGADHKGFISVTER